MKSIMYTSLVLYVMIVLQPPMASAQSQDQPEVLTEEQFLNASDEKRNEVLSNPGAYIVVKDGQKVDVWTKQDRRDHGDSKRTTERTNGSNHLKKGDLNEGIVEKAVESGVVQRKEDFDQKDPEVMEQLKLGIDEKNGVAQQEAESGLVKDNVRLVQQGDDSVPSGSTGIVEHPEDLDPSLSRTSKNDASRQISSHKGVSSVKSTSSEDRGGQPVWLSTDNLTEAQKQFLFSGEGALTEQEYNRLSDAEKSEYVRTRRSVR